MTKSAGAVVRQTRAREPEESGCIERGGVRIAWERHGAEGPDVLLLPTWSIIHSRCWKMQIPDLARIARVISFDGRGNGRSDRPADGAAGYSVDEFVADALAVMDATQTATAVLVALSCGALWATALAADHPDRVEAVAYVGPAVALAPAHPERAVFSFEEPLDTDVGWAKYNRHYWRRDYARFLEFFFAMCFSEPHSTKQIEDCVAWGMETTPDTLIETVGGLGFGGTGAFLDRAPRVRCPTLVMHGDHDLVRPHAQGAALAAATKGRLITLEGSGHLPSARDPVKVNLLLRDFIGAAEPAARWTRAPSRARRALYVSSPIGLGHVRRDLAIADELRRLHPDLEIDWLAQHPVTRVLEERGEAIHPLSGQLLSESGHMQSESREHALHCFQALRRMDEILLANFMVFLDAARAEPYDLWVGDEAWDVDYYLHENPELKTAAYAWLTDFVGYLPMEDGGERERCLTADYNTEMIEQIARYPRVRDRAVFVGEPEDIVPDRFGEGLPLIREWTERHFDFAGYVTGFDPASLTDVAALRAELGYGVQEKVCIVTVGGSGVGDALLRRVTESFAEAKRLVPCLRMIAVAGPRIDTSALPVSEGLEVRAYVPDLHRHLAVCDLAVIQGGLATAMELTATGRRFIYFPLAQHFEQQLHVHHRLRRHRAGRRMDYLDADPGAIAVAIKEELERTVDYLRVPGDGAMRAAALIGELL